MKKVIIIGILMACTCLTAVSKNLHQGEKLVKSIMELEFDEHAKSADAFVTWELVGDWDKFDYSFSQGSLIGNTLTINANEYKEFLDGSEGVALSLQGKSKTDEGEYCLSMKVKEVSDGLDFAKEDLNLDMNINYLLPPPTPLWIKLAIAGGILLVLVLLIVLVLHLTAKFPKGLLQIGTEEVDLKGKKVVSIKNELENNNSSIRLGENVDVVFVKKRFASFQGPCIKEINGCELESEGLLLTTGDVIKNEQEVKGLRDIDNREILIRYI